MADDHDLLRSASVADRLEGISRLGSDRTAMREMLNDKAPFVFHHGGSARIAEVRTRALIALQDSYRSTGDAWDLGSVEVRKAMPALEAVQAAMLALGGMPEGGRRMCLAEAEAWLDKHVVPSKRDRPMLRAYRVLQQLHRVPYERQEVDPKTYLTPVQSGVAATQMVSERPTPHLRFRAGDRTVGYLYKGQGWVFDFDESPEGRDAESRAQGFMRGKGRLPRALWNEDGTPRIHAKGHVDCGPEQLEKRTADPADYLKNLSAFLSLKVDVEFVA